MTLAMKFFNDFDRRFRDLERRSGNDASRIEWLVKNSPDVRRLIGSLYFWEREFTAECAKRRFLRNVPSWFPERYKSYKEHLGPEVNRVYGGLFLLAFFDEEIDGIPPEEILNPNGPPPPKKNDDDENSGWFLPGEGTKEVELMIRYVWHKYYDYLGEEPKLAEDLRAGLAAWEWFTDTVGIDLTGIEERWGKLPRALISSHMEGTTKGSGHDGLVDLLDDATKAYVFGLPAAAVSMCRAVCEHALKEFYFDEDHKQETLGQLAFLAEKRYLHVKQMNLRKYIRLANDVMHSHRGGQLSDEELETVRQFLETTKALIEQAPKR